MNTAQARIDYAALEHFDYSATDGGYTSRADPRFRAVPPVPGLAAPLFRLTFMGRPVEGLAPLTLAEAAQIIA